MERKAERSRSFRVFASFDQFQTGEQVDCILYPDCFAVEGGGAELKIPYSEIQHVAHAETPQRKAADFIGDAPYFFGNSITSLLATSGVLLGMAGAMPFMYKLMFFVGYNDDGQERWVMLSDRHNYETIPFVQSLASRTHTRIIHYYVTLMKELQMASPGMASPRMASPGVQLGGANQPQYATERVGENTI